jgi:hypothetical protein
LKKRWVVLLILITATALGTACNDQTANLEPTVGEAAPPDEDSGEVEAEATLPADVEVAETSGLNLVDSAVCEQFDPPTPAPVMPEPGSLAEIRPDDWIRGPEDAAVTILLYNDFQ